MKVLTDNQYYSEIANVIREQNGTNNTYKPPQMVNALKNLFYEEAEGVPPISFSGIGEDLLDYRIDGASGGVGDRTENLFNKNNVVKDVLQDAGQYASGVGCVMFVIDVRNVSVISFQTTVGTERCRSTFSVEYPAIGVSYTINGQNTFMNSDGQRNKITRSVPIGANYLGVQVYRNSDNYDEEVINNALNSFIACDGNKIGDYEPFGYKVPVVVSGKNLFNGYLEMGSFTATDGANFNTTSSCRTNYIDVAENTAYSVSISEAIIQYIGYYGNGYWSYADVRTANAYNFTTPPRTQRIRIIFKNITGENIDLRVFPTDTIQLEKNSAVTDYEPYHSPVTANIYLDEPLEENESISMRDTGISIPTINGTNILTVDTEIQPSKVYVKARKESQYETIMRERYEEAQAQLDALESEGE